MVKIFKTSIISMPVFVIGSALAALGFAIFFSDFSQGFALDKIFAILVDALLAGAIAMPLCILSNRLDRSRTSPIVSKFIVCFLGGVCAMLLGKVIPICHPDIIMIGNIMNFIPGVAMTNSFRDLFGGEESEDVKRFSSLARELGIYIVAGLILTIGGEAYNCAVLFDSRGEIVGIHKKVHLPAGEELHVAHGDRFEVFHTELGNIGMMVCWDLQFPESVREMALGGADLICVPTLGWENIYGLARAYESSITIAAAMANWGEYTGYCDPSCVVDNMGRILAAGPRNGEAVVTADVDITKEPDPQYGSQKFYNSSSMRKTRFSQRRPETYKLINLPLEETPLYKRYFGEDDNK
jgi:hypothetical protein